MFKKLLGLFTKKKGPDRPAGRSVAPVAAAPVSIDKPMLLGIAAVHKQDHMAASALFGEAMHNRTAGGINEPLSLALRTTVEVVGGFRGGSPPEVMRNNQSFLIQCFAAEPIGLRRVEPARTARYAQALWLLQYLYTHCKTKGHEYALEKVQVDHGFLYSQALEVLGGIGMSRTELAQAGIRPLQEEITAG